MIKFANAPVVGMNVTLAKCAELDGGQEASNGWTGTVANVYADSVRVKFEDVVSDKGGHLYSDYLTVDLEELPELFEEFGDYEIVDDE